MVKPVIDSVVFIMLFLSTAVAAQAQTTMAEMKNNELVFFEGSESVHLNPYKGYAPWAVNMSSEECPEPDFSLAFVLFNWAEIEPEKGVYDFEALEKKHNFEHLTSKDVKFILRFVCDYPGQVRHLDIPDWLYSEIGGAGTYYRNDWAAGFAPDYANEYLMQRHEMLINAIAQRYDNSPDIAFVQLGSVGHWGEWHHSLGNNLSFPPEEVTSVYAGHYFNAFNNKKLQMRRPFGFINNKEVGFFNDMMGVEESTYMWVDWIEDANMKNFHEKAPSGGEFASTYPLEDYFSSKFESVKNMAAASNTSYIANLPPEGEKYKSNSEELLKTIGYRFKVQSAFYNKTVGVQQPLSITINIKNEGVAPFYYDWPIYIQFYNAEDELVLTHKASCDIRQILPGKFAIKENIEHGLLAGEYALKLCIFNPDTNKPGIWLANEETEENLLMKICTITVE